MSPFNLVPIIEAQNLDQYSHFLEFRGYVGNLGSSRMRQ